MSTTMLPIGSLIGQAGADGGGHGLLDELGLGGAGAAGGLGDGPPLDLGDGRRHADHDPGPVEAVDADPLEQQADHALGDLEVGDGALAQGAHRDDVAGRAADHLPRLVAHGQHVLGAAVERDDRRLVEHDALAPARRPGCWRCRGRWRGRGPALPPPVGAVGGRSSSERERRAPFPVVPGDWPSASISRWKSSTLDMKCVGLRCRSHTISEPTRVTTTTMRRNARPLTRRAPSWGTSAMCWLPRAHSEPPSQNSFFQIGHGGLERVDAELAGLEGGAAVGRRDGDDHRRLGELHPALAVPQHDAADLGPAAAGLGGELAQARQDLLRVGLVVDVGHPGGALGVVAHQTTEHHDGATVGDSHPVGRLLQVEGGVGERDPVVGGWREEAHGPPS